MSNGNWRKFAKDRGGLVGALSLAALFVIISLSLAREWQWEADYEATSSAAQYAEDAKNDIAVKCVGLTGQAADDCSDEINDAARENQRNEHDLAAQRTAALWAAVMGWMAVMGVSLSAVGVFLIWGTWKQTAEAAGNSRQTLAIYVAKERGVLVMRGHLYNKIESLPIPHCFSATLDNRGISPARLQGIEWEFLTEQVWPEELRNRKADDGIVAAGAQGPSAFMPGEPEGIGGRYLAVRVAYVTVGQGPFYCHGVYRIDFVPGGGYGEDSFTATQTYIGGMPSDT